MAKQKTGLPSNLRPPKQTYKVEYSSPQFKEFHENNLFELERERQPAQDLAKEIFSIAANSQPQDFQGEMAFFLKHHIAENQKVDQEAALTLAEKDYKKFQHDLKLRQEQEARAVQIDKSSRNRATINAIRPILTTGLNEFVGLSNLMSRDVTKKARTNHAISAANQAIGLTTAFLISPAAGMAQMSMMAVKIVTDSIEMQHKTQQENRETQINAMLLGNIASNGGR